MEEKDSISTQHSDHLKLLEARLNPSLASADKGELNMAVNKGYMAVYIAMIMISGLMSSYAVAYQN